MDFSMFLVFPGILITIGVGLLLLSIIIVIIAYKTADKQEPSISNQNSYDKNIKNENNDNLNIDIKSVANENYSNNIIEENTSEEIKNNDLTQEEGVSKSINNIPENSLENTKTFNFSENKPFNEEIINKEEFPKIGVQKQEEKIDAFEKEFENTEVKQEFPNQGKKEEKIDAFEKEFENVKDIQAEVYPKIENAKTEKSIPKNLKQSKIEEEEEEIEIL